MRGWVGCAVSSADRDALTVGGGIMEVHFRDALKVSLLDYSCTCCHNRHVVAVSLASSRVLRALADGLS